MDIPKITIEDSYYIYHEDGKIFSKHTNDFLKLQKHKCGYLQFYNRNFGKTKSVHRVLYEKFYGEIPDDKQVDHINNVKTDNRLCNLQLLTNQHNSQKQGINSRNTSGYKGISFDKNTNKWRARIYLNEKNIHLGLFDKLEDALLARNQKVIELNAQGHHYI